MKQQGRWTVGPESVRMLELGHPWIIADSYTKQWPKGAAGDLVELTDERGRFLATALLDPTDRIVARVLGRERLRLDRAWLAKQLQAAFEAGGVPNASRWVVEVQEYRPYPTDDPSFAKLKSNLAKYNPSADTLSRILAALSLP